MSADPEPAVGRSRIMLPALAAAAIVIALDQLTKWWALERLDDGSIIDLVGSLRLRLTFNTGFAFSQGQGLGWLIGTAAVVISIVIVGWIRRLPGANARAAAGLVLGGAVGNLIDRLARADDGIFSGGVVDFIDLQWWPVFNIADAAICVGVVGLLITVGRQPEPDEPAAESEPGDGGLPDPDES